jgi:hypothetical protein
MPLSERARRAAVEQQIFTVLLGSQSLTASGSMQDLVVELADLFDHLALERYYLPPAPAV